MGVDKENSYFPSEEIIIEIFESLNNNIRKLSYIIWIYEINRISLSLRNISYMKPTESELEILNILWAKGPSTVRVVHEELSKEKDAGYTTTLKLMQIMHKKGLLNREEEQRSHIYTSAVDEKEAKGALIDRFLDAAFNGSASELVMQALGRNKTSKEELDKIKDLIKKMEGGAK